MPQKKRESKKRIKKDKKNLDSKTDRWYSIYQMEREATITYTRPICDDYALIGLAWDEPERHSDDFDLDSLGKVLACGTEVRKQIGWAVYAKGKFYGKYQDKIKLKEKVIGG